MNLQQKAKRGCVCRLQQVDDLRTTELHTTILNIRLAHDDGTITIAFSPFGNPATELRARLWLKMGLKTTELRRGLQPECHGSYTHVSGVVLPGYAVIGLICNCTISERPLPFPWAAKIEPHIFIPMRAVHAQDLHSFFSRSQLEPRADNKTRRS